MTKQITPIPEKMAKLKLDRRGYPIPFIILIDDEGTPHFKINDSRKVDICLKWKFCAICGTYLREDIWVIGGPGSAFHPQGAYIDTPIHYDCGKYALEVCPYLATKGYDAYAPIEATTRRVKTQKAIFVNPTVDPNRPKVFVFGKISGWKLTYPDPQTRYVVPNRPFLEVEYWDKGVKLDAETAIETIRSFGPNVSDFIFPIKGESYE